MSNKRKIVRIGSVLACLLLVTVLAIPCFALEPPTEPVPPYVGDLTPPDPNHLISRDQLLDAFYYRFQLRYEDALYQLINSSYWSFERQLSFVYQFEGVPVGSTVALDEPLTFNDIDTHNAMLYVRDPATGNELVAGWGHWQTQYTTTGDNRSVMLKFYEYDQLTDAYTDILTIKVRYNKDSKTVIESSVYSGVYPWIDGLFNSYSIATATGGTESCVMQYAVSAGYLVFDVAQNIDTFFDGIYAGFPYGWYDGYLDGWDVGGQAWYEWGYFEGYDEGYLEGLDDGTGGNGGNSGGGTGGGDSYDQGYQDAVNQISSGEFGRNLLGNAFSAPFEALSQFTIVSWELQNGNQVEITLGAVLSAVIGVGLFIWFLKLFAGG